MLEVEVGPIIQMQITIAIINKIGLLLKIYSPDYILPNIGFNCKDFLKKTFSKPYSLHTIRPLHISTLLSFSFDNKD
jgi:hypothetical protein